MKFIIFVVVIFILAETVTPSVVHSISKRSGGGLEEQGLCAGLKQILTQVDGLLSSQITRLNTITSSAITTGKDLIARLGLNSTCVNSLLVQIDVLKSNAVVQVNNCKTTFIKAITDLLDKNGCNVITIPPVQGIDLTCLLSDLVPCLLKAVQGILDGLLGPGGLLGGLLELLRGLLGSSIEQLLENLIRNPVAALLECVDRILSRLQIDVDALLEKIKACVPGCTRCGA